MKLLMAGLLLAVGGCLLPGCTTALTGRGEVGAGSRTDYYFYHEARRSGDTASATLDVKALVQHLIDLEVIKEHDEEIIEVAEDSAVSDGD